MMTTSATTSGGPHSVCVLFYKYFINLDESGSNNNSNKISDADADATTLIRKHSSHYVPLLCDHQRTLCTRLGMRGRVLISGEGMNGTLSAPTRDAMTEYVDAMEGFDLTNELGPPPSLSSPPQNGPSNDSDSTHWCHLDANLPSESSLSNQNDSARRRRRRLLFNDVDWKMSPIDEDTAHETHGQPFPDLKISAVKEIVSTGGAVSLEDIPKFGGTHLSPEEFHDALLGHGLSDVGSDNNGSNGETKKKKKEIVLIDVRNTFEHAVGHFVNPTSNDEAAVDPQMTNFASFDTNYCARNAHDLRDKKVLMYCTGGIRCEKASAMLRKRGVNDVSQLSGGIHRYLERYGSGGLFRGKNFVFDQRVAIAPGPPPADADADADANANVSGCDGTSEGGADNAIYSSKSRTESQVIVVGKCVDCSAAYDEISGSRICTVCRDLVLVCPPCQQRMREYHCQRHSGWKDCYFTFLDMFDKPELEQQVCRLSELRDGLVPPPQHKNVRKTLMRQVNKVRARIQELEAGTATVDREAPRRCRTCHEPDSVCDGLCWGFWKRTTVVVGAEHREGARQVGNSDTCNATALTASDESNGNKRQLHFDVAASADGVTNCGKPLPVDVGDRVKPGPDWNDIRLGTKTISGDEHTLITGHVVEIKSWGSGGAGDCVSVVWDNGNSGQSGAGGKLTLPSAKPKIYRWGVLAKNGQRMYDVEKFVSDS